MRIVGASGTLATHFVTRMRRLWRASLIVDLSLIRGSRRLHRVPLGRRMLIMWVHPLRWEITQRLPMRTVYCRLPLLGIQRTATTLGRHGPSVPQMWVCSVRRHKSLRL